MQQPKWERTTTTRPVEADHLGPDPLAAVAGNQPAKVPQKPAKTKSPVVQAPHEVAPVLPAAKASREVPITLDTVLRLAEAQNAKVRLARERLHECHLASELAVSCWLPKTYAGMAYYRHEGGIQNEDGTLTHSSFGAFEPGLQIRSEWDIRESTYQRVQAERQVWQKKGELSQINYEVLLEAATTYIDLLTARRGEAIAEELEKFATKLLDRTKDLAKEEVGAKVLVEALQADQADRDLLKGRLRQQGNAASAKLAYLLGLPPEACLVPVDTALVPVDLIDANHSVKELATQAMTNGPGVRELEGMLAVIQNALAKSGCKEDLIPKIEFCVGEGWFLAGPGGNLTGDNRLDIGLQVRWDLTQMLTAKERRMVAESKLHQVQLTKEDLQAKLLAGVRESRDVILSGGRQIGLASEQIRRASKAYELSNERLKEGVKDTKTADVLQNIRGMDLAHFNYLKAVNSYNKAQVRLLLLMGPGPAKPGVPLAPIVAPAPLPMPAQPAKPDQLPPPKKVLKADS
jgi:outer membrane protein TolC